MASLVNIGAGGIMRALRGETVDPEPLLGVVRGKRGITANQRKMAAAALLACAEHRDEAADVLSAMLAEEEAQGPRCWELLCPDPHAGMYSLAEVAICTLAERAWRTKQLGERQRILVGQRLALYDLVATPDGDVTGLPGMRANEPSGPPRMAETMEYRELRGLPHIGQRGNRRKLESWGPTRDEQATWSAPSWWWRQLGGRQPHCGVPLPRFRLPLVIQRGADWTLAYFEDPGPEERKRYQVRGSAAARRDDDHVEDCTSAVLVKWGKPGRHEVTAVQSWKEPPPEPPGKPTREVKIEKAMEPAVRFTAGGGE